MPTPPPEASLPPQPSGVVPVYLWKGTAASSLPPKPTGGAIYSTLAQDGTTRYWGWNGTAYFEVATRYTDAEAVLAVEAEATLEFDAATVVSTAAGNLTLDAAAALILASASVNYLVLQSNQVQFLKPPATDTIVEYTGGAGVTIDGVLLKDSLIAAAAVPDTHGVTPSAHHDAATAADAAHVITGQDIAAGEASSSLAAHIELAGTAEVVAGTNLTDAVIPRLLSLAIQGGWYVYKADTAADDNYLVALTPTLPGYTKGQSLRFEAQTANTGACTLNVDSFGAKTIKKHHDQDLVTGDIEAGQIVTVTYDGTNFQMQSMLGQAPAGGGDVTAAAILTDHALVRGDGGGKGVQDSGIIVDDTDNITGVVSLGTDTINEKTVAAGVTVDGLLIKDSGIPEAAVTAHEAAINHDALLNFVANEHFDKTGAFPTTWSDTGITGAELEDLSDGGATTLHSHAGGGAHTILDGSTHSDTVADGVTRGSLIYGNATPKWDEFVIGAANRLLKSDGTDFSWAQADLTTDVTGTLPIGSGGTGQTSQQAAIDALTAVSGATNEHVLTKDTATGNAIFKAAAGGGGAQDVALLDGSEHNDTVAQGPTLGSLIVGNATPKWDELVGTEHAFLTYTAAGGLAWDTTPEIQYLADTAGTTRITLATSNPHVTMPGGVKLSDGWGSLGVGDTPQGGNMIRAAGSASKGVGTWSAIQIAPNITASAANGLFNGVTGTPVLTTAGYSGWDVLALQFSAVILEYSGGATTTVDSVLGVLINPGITVTATNTLTVTTMTGMEVRAGTMNALGTLSVPTFTSFYASINFPLTGWQSVGTYYGFRQAVIPSNFSGSTAVYGFYCGDIAGGTTARMMELANGMYVEGTGDWTAAANETPVWIYEGVTPTARQVKWKDGAAIGGGDKVMVLV